MNNLYWISTNDLLTDITKIKQALDLNNRTRILLNKNIAVKLIWDNRVKAIENRNRKENLKYFKKIHWIDVIIK